MAGDCDCQGPAKDAIYDLEVALYRYESRRTAVEERLRDIKKEKARLIEEQYLAEKTPDLSNAQKRSDASEALVRSDPETVALEEERRSLDIEIRITQIDLGFERRQFQRQYANALLAASGVNVSMGRSE